MGTPRLLSFALDLPEALTRGFAPKPRGNLKHDDEVVARHFRLMNHQLAQARPRATSPDLRPARHLATAVLP